MSLVQLEQIVLSIHFDKHSARKHYLLGLCDNNRNRGRVKNLAHTDDGSWACMGRCRNRSGRKEMARKNIQRQESPKRAKMIRGYDFGKLEDMRCNCKTRHQSNWMKPETKNPVRSGQDLKTSACMLDGIETKYQGDMNSKGTMVGIDSWKAEHAVNSRSCCETVGKNRKHALEVKMAQNWWRYMKERWRYKYIPTHLATKCVPYPRITSKGALMHKNRWRESLNINSKREIVFLLPNRE